MKLAAIVIMSLALTGRVYAGQSPEARVPDAAWDYYAKSQKQIQVAYHHLVRLHLHDLKETVQRSQELQLAEADQRTERFYFLVRHHPEKIVRDQGFNAFVNFPWTDEDEAMLRESSKDFQKRQKQIDKLKLKLEGDPGYAKIHEKLRALSGDIEYRKIHSRFRFVPRDVETLLSGQALTDAENTF